MGYSLAAGGFDEKKHKSMRECVRLELMEEARLAIPEDKLVPFVGLNQVRAKGGVDGRSKTCHS